MSFSVNTNNEAMAAIRLLKMTNRETSIVQERINSGLKINSAKDNASTFAIASGMRSDVQSLSAVEDSLSMGQAVTNVAVSAGETVLNKLQDLQTEVVKANDETADRSMIQETVDSLLTEIGGIVNAAQFNGVNMLNNTDGDLTVLSSINRTDPSTFTTSSITVGAENLTNATLGIAGLNIEDDFLTMEFGDGFAAAVADAQTITITAGGNDFTFEFVDDPDTTALTHASNILVEYDAGDSQGEILASFVTALGEEGFSASYDDLGRLEITSGSNGNITANTNTAVIDAEITDSVNVAGVPATALTKVESALTTVKQALSRLGTSANALETQKDFVKQLSDNLTSGVGALVDADMAEESAKLQALQTKQQLGIQALSIANQQPGSVLSLFR